MESCDVLIVGAGIAGASLAYFLGEQGVTDVLVLERESHAAVHATGRSAATLVELDPIDTLQRLKMLGARFLQNPPSGFSEHPLLDRRGLLGLFREPQWSAIRQAAPILEQQGLGFQLLDPIPASARIGGVLDPEAFAGAVFVPDDGFLDVHQLLYGYIGQARLRGARFRFETEVQGLLVEGGRCRGAVTAAGEVRARVVVNAAGAWVGEIARATGALAIPFSPMRRSIVVFTPVEDVRFAEWPLVWSDTHRLYFRPESGGLLFCPMDECAMHPCDPAPDVLAIAEGLERLRALAPRLVPRSKGRAWAGLRTFSPDRVPVVGEDPLLPGYFWLGGQGGCGIETSPALGALAADLLTAGKTTRFDADLLSPARFLHAEA